MKRMTSEQAAARATLIGRMENWRKERNAIDAQRDALIREGAADEMSNSEIAAHMEIGRNTVISVLGAKNSSEGEGER